MALNLSHVYRYDCHMDEKTYLENCQRGQWLKRRRRDLGLSVEEVASHVGVKVAAYRNWEKTLSFGVALRYQDRLTEILAFSPEKFLEPVVNQDPTLTAQKIFSEKKRSLMQRHRLSEAMRRQRILIGQTQTQIAQDLNVSLGTYRSWESLFPQRRPSEETLSRLEQVLGVPSGWLDSDALEPAPVAPPVPQKAAGETAADEIRAIGNWLSRRDPLRRTAQPERLSAVETRAARIFAQRYGVLGHEQSTLQALGDAWGITRERARQILSKMTYRCKELKFPTPIIDALAQEIEPHLPVGLEQADQQFREKLGENLSIRTLDTFTREILGRNLFRIEGLGVSAVGLPFKPFLVAPKSDEAVFSEDTLRAIRSQAMSMIRVTGAAHLFYVAGAAGAQLGQGITPDQVERVVRCVPGFAWVQRENGWFWFGEAPGNRLLNAAKKLMCVTRERVDVRDIVSGFVQSRRHFKSRAKRDERHAVEPPWEVARDVLAATTWCKVVQHNDFILTAEFDDESVFSEVELFLRQRLRELGGVATHKQLRKELDQAGLTREAGLQIAIMNSPIIYRPEFGLISIRGLHIETRALAQARAAAKASYQKKPHSQHSKHTATQGAQA